MIQTAFYDAPYGRYVMAAEDGALTGVWLEGQKYFPSGLPEPSDGEAEIFAHTRRWLDAYFAGRQPDVSALPIAPRGSAFAQSVWQLLLAIPYGQTVTYGELAKRLAEQRGLFSWMLYILYILVVLFVWGAAGKGNRNVSQDFSPETDNQKLDETKEILRERSRWSAFWR